MDRIMSLGVLAACAGLAACGGSSSSTSVVVPTLGERDSAISFGTTAGAPAFMLLADSTGVSDNEATITFNADNTYAINLPGVAGPIIISDSGVSGLENTSLGTTETNYAVVVSLTEIDVDIHLGEDDAGNDLFILARIEEDAFNQSLDTMSFVVFGDETESAALPTGNGIAYTGGFISVAYDEATDSLVAEYAGGTEITANFGLGKVDLTFTDTSESSGVVFQATGIDMIGAQYEGDLIGVGGGSGFTNGRVIGAFYGAGAEATAGTFNAVDDSGGPGNEVEVIGGFTGFK